ncbi:MAG: ABC transporter permease [Lachnospiraceae bacterium]|nr:ABC transporter permease [Lachnospiraceae bacterium]
MKFYQLAFRYLYRKKSKAFLLFLVMLVINSMILSSSIILRASEESRLAMQKKMGTKVVLEAKDKNQSVMEAEIKKLQDMEEVAYLNRIGSSTAYPVNFNPVTKSDSEEENNQIINLQSCDNLEYDNGFDDLRYRLIKGNTVTKDSKNEAVINFMLAEANGLEIGDELEIGTQTGNVTTVKITGMYVAGNESNQMNELPSADRLENRIFIDNHSYTELFDTAAYQKIAIYIKNPNQITAVEKEMKELFGNRVNITTSDVLYQQLEVPLKQAIRVMKVMLIFTLIAGVTVISLLLCMWMRARKREVAVFVSMGRTKTEIFMQFFLETINVFCLSVCFACISGRGIAGAMKKLLTGNAEVSLSVSLHGQDIAAVFFIGGLTVILAVCISLTPVLRAKPKDILSKMEG